MSPNEKPNESEPHIGAPIFIFGPLDVGEKHTQVRLAEFRSHISQEMEVNWWSLRFLETVAADLGAVGEEEKDFAAECFIRLAKTDARWALSRIGAFGPEAHHLLAVFDENRLKHVLTKIQLEATSQEAMLKAKLILGWASMPENHRNFKNDLWWRMAWQELQRVPETERDVLWTRAALQPTAVVEYPTFLRLASERLLASENPFDAHMILPNAISTAAAHRDWETFEKWARQYRALPEPFLRSHAECQILNLEGLRALEEGRLADVEEAMRKLLARADSATFLTNPEVSGLPRKLKAAGLFKELTDEFGSLVKKRDWRLHTKNRDKRPS